jgi:hypothetical protein
MGMVVVKGQRPSVRPVSLANLRDVILLGGAVRAGGLATQIGRPVFELPVTEHESVLDLWRREVTTLATDADRDGLSIRVMMDRAARVSTMTRDSDPAMAVPLVIECDPFEYRGAGGVLRDAAARYEDDNYLLVANAAQVLIEPLHGVVQSMAATHSDLCVLANLDGTPSGLFLVRCGALRDLPAAGFIDLKEQALPTIAARHDVRVVQRPQPAAMPIRTAGDYALALRRYSQRVNRRLHVTDPFAEDWEPAFRVVEKGAAVSDSARLHDSTVLSGGCVEAGAVLVRTIVCEHGIVRAGQVVVDEVVSSGAKGRNRS